MGVTHQGYELVGPLGYEADVTATTAGRILSANWLAFNQYNQPILIRGKHNRLSHSIAISLKALPASA